VFAISVPTSVNTGKWKNAAKEIAKPALRPGKQADENLNQQF